VPSPILRETIKKLRARKAQLEKQVKGPLEEIRQIEEDLEALGAASPPRRTAAPRGANQAAILRAIRNGATTPEEVAAKTGLSTARVNSSLASYINSSKLVTRGMNGLTLTKSGRERLRELRAKQAAGGPGAGRR
jgi:hypothetical protein